jgi:asparaginyl-tRNA synthetase
MHVYIEDIARHEGEVIEIKGWVYNVRSSGKVRFLLVRDGTGVIQSVISQDDVAPEIFKAADSLTQESSVILTGLVKADKRAPGGYELVANKIEIVQLSKDYPITPKEHSVEFLLPIRHLWLRSKKQHAVLRIRHTMVKAIRDFLDGRGFVNADTPILTPASVEGTTTLFPVEYYGTTVYLAQSGQLYNEATAAALGKVYCFGPTFRAEKSKTRRHLTEFWMVEPEVAYMDLDELMELEEDFVVYVVGQVLEYRKEELKIIERDIKALEKINKPFPRISYKDAVEIINKKDHEFKYGEDFGAPHETLISENFDLPVMVHHYPASCKAFYMKHDAKDDSLSLSVDMIAPEGYGEITGGGQREEDYDIIMKRIKDHKLSQEDYKWYLDLRKYGTCPHSGFGLGLERTIAWICKLPHLRETIPFPRMLEKVYP